MYIKNNHPLKEFGEVCFVISLPVKGTEKGKCRKAEMQKCKNLEIQKYKNAKIEYIYS